MLVIAVLVAVVAVLVAWLGCTLLRRSSTWQRKGVPGPRLGLLGFLGSPKVLLLQENMGDLIDRVYTEYRNAPIAGTYILGNPLLHVHDPEIIKHVFIKDFQDFSSRGTSAPRHDKLAGNVFTVSGPRWRYLRVKLAPAFTSGKIKYMFPTIRKTAEQLAVYLAERVSEGGGRHVENARSLMMSVFLDIISSVAFGIESDTVRNPDSAFRRAINEAVAPSFENGARFVLQLFARELCEVLGVNNFNARTTAFFCDLVRETVGYREGNRVERADLMQMLIQLKNEGFVSGEDGAEKTAEDGPSGAVQKLTIDDIAAQVFVFMVAGFESSASTTSFTLYEMAKHPEVQEKALREVDEVMAKFGGEISYEAVMSMPYLDKAISETLRKYPPLSFLTREAVVTRNVPLTEVEIDKGTRLVVPVRALHYDPQYWPDPEKYDPERFSDEQKAARPAHVYLPFGDGPRICIAARLGLVQIKTTLLTLLSAYRVSVEPDSPEKVAMNPRSFAITPVGSLDVCFHPRDSARLAGLIAGHANEHANGPANGPANGTEKRNGVAQ